MNIPPIKKPTVTGIHAMLPLSQESLTAGSRSDQKLADNMMPAAKPSEPSKNLLFNPFEKNTTAEPKAVKNHVKHPAIST
jgi:hypothetical protein